MWFSGVTSPYHVVKTSKRNGLDVFPSNLVDDFLINKILAPELDIRTKLCVFKPRQVFPGLIKCVQVKAFINGSVSGSGI